MSESAALAMDATAVTRPSSAANAACSFSTLASVVADLVLIERRKVGGGGAEGRGGSAAAVSAVLPSISPLIAALKSW